MSKELNKTEDAINYSVYKHIFPNGKVYIGITSKKPQYRWGRDGAGYFCKTNGKYNQPILVNAIKKYGWNQIKHEILFKDLTKEEAEIKEVELIAYYNSNNIQFGYNIEKGGNAKGKVSEETRRKIGESEKGEKHHFYGKHRSEEVKQKIRESKLGTTMSEEAKRKISKALIGKKLSDETKKKMSESKSGEKHPMYGKPRPEALKAAVWKSVRCVETDKLYKSITQASVDTGISLTGISKACLGKLKTSGGYHWEFIK